jgi:putative oxygen-independent coproporphyrinogen III oxidase
MNPVSIYIHWPFCLSLCPYCDFNSHLSNEINHDSWLEAYKKEIDYFADKIKGRVIKSIFFGGGTPSLMKSKTVFGIIQKLASLAEISTSTEITLEANPTSYETEKFREFKAAGINRVSIGVQSFQQKNLEILGRKHSAKEAISAIESASNLFDRYSFDLIYAIPEQNLAQWKQEVEFALSLAGGHISLYQLTIEKGTPFYQLFKSGKMPLPSNDLAATMYEWTSDYLQEHKYKRYEISNYAVQGQECVHNLCYWNYNEYIGIGPGAHSRLHEKNSIKAVMMIHKPEKWLQSVAENGHGILNNVSLAKQEIVEEMFMMGTRLELGISEKKFYQITKNKFLDSLNFKTIEYYMQQGLVDIQNGYLALTDRGLMLHNYLVPRMLL